MPWRSDHCLVDQRIKSDYEDYLALLMECRSSTNRPGKTDLPFEQIKAVTTSRDAYLEEERALDEPLRQKQVHCYV